MKILLVDDKEENLYLLGKLFQGNGYETLSAANGAEALAIALKTPPDLIVSDILMPVMDGFTLCREWRKNKILKNIPFVIYTATYTDSKNEDFALSIGADRFIIKPYEMNSFLKIIKETLNEYKTKKAHPMPARAPEEKVFLKEYNEALIRKLEDKMSQLETVERELRGKNADLEKEIEERKQAEKAIQLINHTFKSIQECISITDSHNNILFVNQAFLNTYGYTENELIGKSINIVRADVPPVGDAILRETLVGGWQGELFNRKKDGTIFPISLSTSVVYDEKKQPIALVGVAIDITERKEAEDALRAKEEKYKQLFDASPDGIILIGPDARIARANIAMARMYRYDSPEDLIGVYPPQFVAPSSREYSEQIIRRRLIGEDIPAVEYELVRKDGTTFYGETLATILRNEDGTVTSYICITRDTTERKRVEDALRESEEKYRTLVEKANEAITIAQDYLLIFVNPRMSELLGVTEENLQGKPFIDFVWPEDRELVMANYRKRIAREQVPETYDFRIIGAGGNLTWIYFSAALILWKGKQATLNILTDITERKRAEFSLQESEERYNALFDRSLDLIYICSFEGKFIDANNAALNLLGYKKEEIGFLNFASLLSEDQLPLAFKIIQEIQETGIQKDLVEFRLKCKNGDEVYVETKGSSILSNGIPVAIQSIARDITERKHTEDALRESERELRETQKMAQLGHWIWDVKTGEVEWSEEVFKTFQLDPKTFTPQLDSILALSPWPEDHERDKELIRKAMESHEKSSYEQRFLRPDKSIGYYFSTFQGKYDDAGNLLFIIGTVQDITIRKQAETLLKQSETRYRLLADHMKDTVWLMDMDLKTTYISPSVEKLRGFTLKELQQLPLDRQFAPASFKLAMDAFSEEIPKVMADPDCNILRTLELEFYRKDGTTYWSENRFSLIRDENGSPKSIMAEGRDITERKQVEEAIRESEEKFRMVFENVFNGISIYYEDIDPSKRRLVECNERYASMAGRTREELLRLGNTKALQRTLEDSANSARQESLLTNSLFRGSFSWIRPDGKDNIIEYIGVPITMREKLYTIGIDEDVTERRHADEALRETRDYLGNLLSFANAPIIVWDPEFKVTRFNLAIERLTGYTIYEVIGKHLEMLFPPESRESSLSLIAPTSQGDHLVTIEIPILCKNGNVHTVLWSSANIYAADGQTLLSTIAQGQDITEQKKLQQQLLQAQKMESIGTLAGGIAHDFNNILGIILGYSSLMDRGTMSPDKFHESLGIINNAVGRGASLVRQILTFARKTDVVFEPMSLTDLIHELLSMFQQTFPKLITFIEDVDKNLPLINADRTQIHQVLLNLCVNARDAMPNGGLLIIKAEKQTKEQVLRKVLAADQDSYICVSVTDTGEGMDELTLRQIFDPFFTTKEQGKGTGLGLAVVYGIIQSHHSFIDVESIVGRGTIFRLYFPVPAMSEKNVHVPAPAESFDTGGTESILLVEDEDALRDIVRLLLESKGYKVYTVQNGKEAVNVYKQNEKEIALTLTDMGLPGMTGADVFKKLREINSSANVVLASGFFEPDIKSELDKAGAKGFIQKPYSPDEVLRKIREVLDKKEI
jgi:PAS domain S-box-containing protein